MYNARINALKQEFVIEFEGGNFIACRAMPYQQVKNPGREALMANKLNQEAWHRICQLVMDANGNLEDSVSPKYSCPFCKENRGDKLIWNEFGRIDCQSCGHGYTP